VTRWFGGRNRWIAACRALTLATTASVTLIITMGVAAADTPAEPVGEVDTAVLFDERAIIRLLNEYVWLLDTRDFDGYGRLFSHGVILDPDGKVVARGAAEVAAMARHYLGRFPEDLHFRHVLSSPVVDVDSSTNTATARAFLLTIRAPAGKSAFVYRVARYVDRFEKADGIWRFRSRQELTDWVLEEYSVHFDRASRFALPDTGMSDTEIPIPDP